MAQRPKTRKVSGDEERILHFEWHASHFRSVDLLLPALPESSNLMLGMPEDQFHGATIRFAILRKFIFDKEPVRLDLVAKSMRKLRVGSNPDLEENLAYVQANYKALTRGRVRVGINEKLLDRDDIYENIVNGLVLHSDVERRDLFDMLHIGTIHGEALRQRDLRSTVLSMLLTIEAGREEGFLRVGKPLRRIWEPQNPSSFTIEP